MPDRADKFDPDTLNPLLNPVLASHMGRWAEVYFTNPPEKREQAVSDLLRELEEVAVPAPASVEGISGMSAKESPETADSLHSSASTSEVVYTCGVCGYKNSDGHSFCGMCGAPLQVAPETEVPEEVPEVQAPPVVESAAIARPSWYERSLDPKSAEETIEPAVNSNAAREPGEALEAIWRQMEKEPDIPNGVVEPEPPAHRYRLYIAAVLAVILAAFGFGVWRGTQARSGASASSSTAASPNSQSAPVRGAQPANATPTALPPRSEPAPAVQNQKQASSAEVQPGGSQIAPQTAPQAAPVPASSSAVATGSVPAGQGGAGELAIAEEYLNGTSGMTRDSGEAAQWLWKAVSKRNVDAALALSDLYSRGDGVPKNCDQARLLLDAAARKGSPAAAEQLRRLQGSNCE
ncbi:MAG: zinc-ribbon domain-containing protein [Candidatus Sulfotelmatobacter sp.]